MNYRFALRNYKGVPVRYFLVEEDVIEHDEIEQSTEPTHHVFIVDASGSMSGDMRALKATIEKLLTLEEYRDAETLISLISYASHGDVTTHFSRVPVGDINEPGSSYIKEVRRLRTRGLTCISQAMDVARGLIREGEITCVSLHSDGYANDRSASSEQRLLKLLIRDYEAMENAFVNTIAYRKWSDFKLLSGIANALSGRCLQANRIKDVFDALHDTTRLLAGRQAPAVTSEAEGFDYQVFVSASGRRVNGTKGRMVVRGLKYEDDNTIYRYREVDAEAFDDSRLPECGADGVTVRPLAAYAKAQLAQGNLNAAKYALVSVRDPELLDAHAKALTNDEIVFFSGALEDLACDDLAEGTARSAGYGFDTTSASVLEILGIMDDYPGQISVDLRELFSHYTRATVKRVPGTRQDDGSIQLPWLETRYLGDTRWAPVLSFDINRTDADVDMLVGRRLHLIERETGDDVDEIAGIDVSSLKGFNNYKVVSGGEVSVQRLCVKLHSKKIFRRLAKAGAVSGDYDPQTVYTIELGHRPLVDFDQALGDMTGVYPKILKYRVLESLLKALMKQASVDYTDEQIAELKRHYLSPSLNVSLPSTTEYTDRDAALADGSVDTKIAYKVNIGDAGILNPGKLRSANAYLKRRFAVTIGGVKQKKPNMMHWWQSGFQATVKTLSARTHLDPVDALMMPIFEDFLGLGSDGLIVSVLREAGIDDDLLTRFQDATNHKHDEDETEEIFHDVQVLLRRATARLYNDTICPLVFYVGATGLLPDGVETIAMTAEQLKARHPNIKLSKSDLDDTFFEVGDMIITVFTKLEYFSTGRTADEDEDAA